MSYRTHINFGILFGLLFTLYFYSNNPNLIMFLVVCSIASLVPDIDHPKSYFTNKVTIFKNKYARHLILISYIIILGYLIYEYKYYILILSLIWLILALTLKHRYFTHSIIGTIIFIIPFVSTPYLIPVLIGYVSHIFSDMLTNRGVYIFFPSKKKVKLGNFTTGSSSETVLRSIIMVINLFLIYKIMF